MNLKEDFKFLFKLLLSSTAYGIHRTNLTSDTLDLNILDRSFSYLNCHFFPHWLACKFVCVIVSVHLSQGALCLDYNPANSPCSKEAAWKNSFFWRTSSPTATPRQDTEGHWRGGSTYRHTDIETCLWNKANKAKKAIFPKNQTKLSFHHIIS